MKLQMPALVGLLPLLVCFGCDKPPDINLRPVLSPAENRDAEANTYRNWRPDNDRMGSIEIDGQDCSENLRELIGCSKWSGKRLRVTGMKDGFPVTESVGPWHIILVPTAIASVVEMKGFLFAKNLEVKLDLHREVMTINGVEFIGTPLTGNSPMVQGAKFTGVKFESKVGLTMGSAAILFLEDGRALMDFDKVLINGKRAREYGILTPAEE